MRQQGLCRKGNTVQTKQNKQQAQKQAMYAVALGLLGLIAAGDASQGPKAWAAPIAPAGAEAVKNSINTITKVSVSAAGDVTKITVSGTQAFTPNVQSLTRPSATVITIAGKWSAGRTGYTNVRKNNVFNVRAGRFSDAPHASVRIVANTRGVLVHAARPLTSDKTQWEIVVGNAQSVQAAADAIKVGVVASEPLAPAIPALTVSGSKASAPAPQGAARLAADLARPVAATGDGRYPALLQRLRADAPAAKSAPAPPRVTPVVFRTPIAPVAADRTYAAAPETPAVVIAAPVAPSVRVAPAPAERRVSLDFVNADIIDVLKALSLQSGLNVVAGSDVKGTVTVALKNVAMIDALDMVTRLSGFRYAKVGTTYVVGTGASVAALSRSSSVGQALSATIPYYYSDGATLEKSILQAFPNVNLSRVDVGSDAKGGGAGGARTVSQMEAAAAVAQNVVPGSTESVNQNASARYNPRGGVMNVVGTQDEVDAVRLFVEGTEEGLVSSARRQQESAGKLLAALTTETYRLKYASPSELAGIVSRLVPSVQIQAGPTQSFQPRTLNGSASFSASPSPGGTTAGGGAGGNTGVASGNAVAQSGPLDPALLPPTLILTGLPPDLARARAILEQNDVRVPQMVFEAKVVDINSSDIKQLGLRYDLSRTVSLGEPNLKAQGQAPTVGATYSNDLRKPNFGTILRSPYSIDIALDALENDNKARVLARPNLSALDGQSATVFIGDQIKYVINIQNTTTGQNIQTETATVGITLKVTGKASPDGTITLYVHPEVSAISSYLTLTNGVALPQIATRFVDTTIRVKDGETVGIGGLIREADINNIQKVPLLGDIPFFGRLFQSRNTQKIRSEVIVFITSRVLKD